MEQKKLLWVLVAVSGFLILVFGFAMILYSSGRDSAPTLRAATPTATIITRSDAPTAETPGVATDANGTNAVPAQGTGAESGLPPPAQGGSSPINVTIVNGENASANYTTLDVSGLTGETSGAVMAVPLGSTQSDSNPIQSSSSPETTPPTGTDKSASQSTTPRMETVPPAPKTTAPAKSSSTTATKTATVAKSTVTTAKTPVTVTEYWIQTGSFNGKLNAEKARDTLKARYLNTEIFTKDVSGSTVYRVRVGPYSKKSEADYWLGVVKEIQGFTGSYVSEVKTKR